MTSRQQHSFPRQYARTRRFTLGAPRSFTVAPDGSRVVFLRAPSGTDPVNRLYVLDLDGERPRERLAADPKALLGGGEEHLSAQERTRRERGRETAGGVVGYATDAAVELAAFALSGRLYAAELRTGAVRRLPASGPVIDPRPSPDGRLVAYVARGALRVVSVRAGAEEACGADGVHGAIGAEEARGGGAVDRVLAEPEGEHVTYGLAEHAAAESMGRPRGFWWSPESDRLLVARVDDGAVRRWWISDPAHPDREPVPVAYPAAGTDNADVRLFLVGVAGGERTEVVWDRGRYPYLARVHWSAAGAPLLLVQARDQRTQRYLAVDPGTGATRTVHVEEDGRWLELIPGAPAWAPGGRLVRVAEEDGARVVVVDDRPLTGRDLHIRNVLDVGDGDVLVSASAGEGADDPEIGQIHVYRVSGSGVERISEGPGVHGAVRGGPVTVLVSAVPDGPGARVRVLRDGKQVAAVASYAEVPVLSPRVALTVSGPPRVPCAVLLPRAYEEGDGPLPVLMDPYGGPHGQRVVAAHDPHLTSQWFADQGFAVVVADGRGTPGRSPAWEKAIAGRPALVLDDQVAALEGLAGRFPLDLGRVAIRGWSYGGWLAALAVLRRPDVFHAAVVGAPVTDQRLYDTHYTERYLGGLPQDVPEVYRANSLVWDDGLVEAREPARPMMIIHGLADDNVVAAHTLRLSSALLAAGRPHEVLPLTGVTHMTPQEQVAENLLLLQVDFLKRSLGLP
ncbi:prolyl oligopeptidase family serine peptidase [Streptomyces sp. TRM76323]|uniref:Prolyl oligopeptidase family serine peptidase n=1 Tax=Streptomyces tamarix TaxID=3078565 RepID=A0ABU3QS89_9ACTN|nr:prolyl oligopeptidase family serine peptidase [Streptomyces tamarix]MDT9685666.1 prolyl oligopeptidase family serine peptidase [Streptomyces tamarix]